MRFITGLVQAVQHLDGILRNVCARDIVFGTRDDQGLDDCVLLALLHGQIIRHAAQIEKTFWR
jgi:hypothetical protein